jgi:RimJ/RimL family protein N-acetyltransferase
MAAYPAAEARPAGGIRLETDNLVLRGWEDRDRAAMAAIQADPRVRRFFPRRLSWAETQADIDNSVARAAAEGFHTEAAELRQTGELVGLIGINHIPQVIRDAIPSRPLIEIGWVLAPRFWGRGLATEGARAWLAHAWSIRLDEVIATTSPLNLPSRRVMEKLGMRHDPADDYGRPTVPAGHPLRPHLVYRIANPARSGR